MREVRQCSKRYPLWILLRWYAMVKLWDHASTELLSQYLSHSNPDEVEMYVAVKTVSLLLCIVLWFTYIRNRSCSTEIPLHIGLCLRLCEKFYRPTVRYLLQISTSSFGPLKACLEPKHENLIMFWTRLSLLEIRFERLYSPEEDIQWTRSFCTSTDLFDLITKTPLKHMAASLTAVDKAKLEQASKFFVLHLPR